jgi:hypothetical protein
MSRWALRRLLERARWARPLPSLPAALSILRKWTLFSKQSRRQRKTRGTRMRMERRRLSPRLDSFPSPPPPHAPTGTTYSESMTPPTTTSTTLREILRCRQERKRSMKKQEDDNEEDTSCGAWISWISWTARYRQCLYNYPNFSLYPLLQIFTKTFTYLTLIHIFI